MRYHQIQKPVNSFADWPTNAEPFLRQQETSIAFPHTQGGPSLGRAPENGRFFARWTTTLQVSKPEAFEFSLWVEDAGRLYVDGHLLLDSTTPWHEAKAETELSAGEHQVKLDFMHKGGWGGCQLFWNPKGASPSAFPLTEPTLYSAVTDQRGEFHFSELPPARYRVSAQVPGGYVYADAAPASQPRGELNPDSQTTAALFAVERGKETPGLAIKTAPFKKGNWKTYTRLDGLAHDQVTAIQETRDGMMWFATLGGGVSRWDGRTFVNYTTANGLPTNTVACMAEDEQGGLWFGTPGAGACRWDGKGFRRFTGADGLPSESVRDILAEPNGPLWFATDAGVCSWNGKGFERHPLTGAATNRVNAVFRSSKGDLWLATQHGLYQWRGETFSPVMVTNGPGSVEIHQIQETTDGRLWFLLEGSRTVRRQLAWWDGAHYGRLATADGLPDGPILSLLATGDGNLWIGTTAGAARFDGKSSVRFSVTDGLAQNVVLSIHQDRDGVMWFGTFGGGLSRYDPNSLAKFTQADGLVNLLVNAIAADDSGQVWFGTEGGASRWDGQKFVNFTTLNGLPNNSVQALAPEAGGKICRVPRADWSGGMVSGFEVFGKADGLPDIAIRALHHDRLGRLWIGTLSQ